MLMQEFYGYIFLMLMCIVCFGACNEHQSTDCKRKRQTIKCGNTTLEIKPWRNIMKYSTLTLTALSEHKRFLNNTLEIPVNDKLQIVNNYSCMTTKWKLNLKNDGGASHILLATSDNITFLREQDNVHGYLSHHVGLGFYNSTANKHALELLATTRKIVSLRITFNMIDDSTLGVFSNDGYIIIRGSLNLSCVPYNKKPDMVNRCRVIYSSVSFVTCECSFREAKNFVVAVKTTITVLPHSKNILAIYFWFTLFSSMFLILTFALLLRFRKYLTFGNVRFKVQLNLTLSFLFRHLTLLTGLGVSVFDPPNRVFCNVMAILHFYFLTTSVLWILLEGVMIYRKVCKLDLNIPIRKLIIACVSVWVLPFALTVGVLIFGVTKDQLLHITESYRVMNKRLVDNHTKTEVVTSLLSGERKYCFCWVVSNLAGNIGSVVVSASLLINTVILVWVGVLVWKIEAANNKNLPAESPYFDSKIRCQIIRTIRAVAILTMVLGLPWLFTLLYNIITSIEQTNSIAPTAIALFFVFLQGPALFYLYCVQNKEFRHAYKRAMTKNKLRRSVG